MAQALGLLPAPYDRSCQQPTAKASYEASHGRPSNDLPAEGRRACGPDRDPADHFGQKAASEKAISTACPECVN